ncbi:tRNA (adenosine(37)-N6)-threonylcarbamoyltransferase complex dimerization subunit type 1 TsaB [Thiobacter aerophilum]|uniref:tRNA (Adenosine(37)-N6)-threonylcarbamoyltransferase complex dimerization subunit type 1 TsaB n=1 Tax=Thiobacter aerophilum TaxID=3121275 RepID=A0ABV0EBC6_9BURK
MRVLAFDTSTEYLSVALRVAGDTLSRDVKAAQQHSDWLLDFVHELLAEAGLALNQLDCIAFGQGPGTFTGLRIACGVAQGLAFGADLPVAPVCTLLALAAGSRADRVITCLDARMGELYHAAFLKAEAGWQTLVGPNLCAPEASPSVEGGHWTGVGSGFSVHHEALARRYAGQLVRVDGTMFPHAADIAALAEAQGPAAWIDPEQAAPFYLRDKVALKTSER